MACGDADAVGVAWLAHLGWPGMLHVLLKAGCGGATVGKGSTALQARGSACEDSVQ